MSNSFYLLLFCAISLNTINGENLPAFIWGTKENIYFPALQTYSSSDLVNFIVSEKTDNTLTVVFFEDYITNTDLTKCKDAENKSCFQYLQSLKHKSYIPSVENPLEALVNLATGEKRIDRHLNTDGSIDKIEPESKSTIFVSLADTKHNENNVAKFKRHDKVMKKFVEQLSENHHVIAIYTGNHSIINSHHIKKRQAKDSNLNYVNEVNKFAFVYSNFTYKHANEAEKQCLVESYTFKEDGKITTITLKLTEGNSMQFDMHSKYGGWGLENFIINNESARAETVSINKKYSYKCGPGLLVRSKKGKMRITIKDLQFQPYFKDGQDLFDDAWDCVGFTTPTIWSGLFVAFILIFILSIGFAWMFDIKTMDRFDDPKGKTITITEME